MARTPRKKTNTRREASKTSTEGKTDLTLIRQRIDEVDARLQALMNERAELAQSVGQSKKSGGGPVEFFQILAKGPRIQTNAAPFAARLPASRPVSAWKRKGASMRCSTC